MSPVIPGQPGTSPIPPAPNIVRNVLTNALWEINVTAPGENPDPAELAFALSKFCQLLDSWSTQQVYIFTYDLISATPAGVPFLLTPGLSPHTIGPPPIGTPPPPPAPSFLVNGERPVRLVSANIVQNNVAPPVRFPLEIRDKDWWSKQRVQTIQTSLPTDLYYRPDWPLGSLFFWPVPNFAYQVEFEIETFLNGAPTLDTIFAFPPGYELAITQTLAELLCSSFEKQPGPTLIASAMAARKAVQGLNSAPPRINLNDFGPPSTSRPRASWNYHSGLDK